MSRKVYEGIYSFTPASRTISFDSSINKLRQVLVVQNLTRSVMLYNFADSTLGGSLTNSVLTLAFDTASHNSGDELLVFFEPNEVDVAVPAKEVTVQDLYYQMSLLLDRLEFGLNLDTAKKLNVNATATMLSGTITTLTNNTNLATGRAFDMPSNRTVESLLDFAFINGITNNITF